ncbi:MAG: hypothetical protein P1U38_00030 [Aeromicrobium sp.]|nr:hypothetical protein [Aeromicrobium sp.]MCK5890888.1 hypothetical protein [Aeromicrobium sp.]MDF1703139.1 hypothetical protein [Aeromicrobium sp.]
MLSVSGQSDRWAKLWFQIIKPLDEVFGPSDASAGRADAVGNPTER